MLNFLDTETFLSDFYEKDHWLGRNAITMKYAWSDVNAAMYGWDPSDGRMRLYNDGVVAMETYTEAIEDVGLRRLRVLKDKLYEQMGGGATLILNRLDLKCPNVSLLTHRLGQFVGEQTIANGYASFGGKGAFERHWDTHDVFAVQLIGRKKWTVYRPTLPLPMPNQKSAFRKDECPSDPVLETELDAGDVLYIPRGWWHATECFVGEESFHIAVGIHAPKIVDYATWVCSQVMPKHLQSRLSVKWESEGVDTERFATTLMAEMRDTANLAAFKEIVAGRSRRDTPFALERMRPNHEEKSPKTIIVNSPYRQPLSSGRLISNGFKIQIDLKSRVALARGLAGLVSENKADEQRELRLLEDLWKKDIIFTTE